MAHHGHSIPHVGNDVHDGTAVFFHVLIENLSGHEETAHQIGSYHGFKAFLVDGGQGGRELPARVVDEAVDGSVVSED